VLQLAEVTYIAEPPFFEAFGMSAGRAHDIKGARVLGIFGDFGHHRPHLARRARSRTRHPPGKYLIANGVPKVDFNSYGARPRQPRGDDARHIRQRAHQEPDDSAQADGSRLEGRRHELQAVERSDVDLRRGHEVHRRKGVPTVVFGGEEYGTGSSRDWAAKGTQLLGVKAVCVRSFERIHRSNLVGMGVLPLQFKGTDSVDTLKISGDEVST
jgi:aconitate hydratase